MKTIRVRKAIAVYLCFVLLFSVIPFSALADTGQTEAVNKPEETVIVTPEAPTEELETGQEVSETTALGSETQALPEVENCVADLDPNDISVQAVPEAAQAEMNVQKSENGMTEGDNVKYVGETGNLHRSITIGGHAGLGWLFYPKNGANAQTFSWTYKNGATATAKFGEWDSEANNYRPTVLHYLSKNGNTTPNTVRDYKNNPVVYCIQPEKGTANGRAYESQALTSLLTTDQIEAIKLVCAYGWPWGYTDQPNGAMNTDEETAFQYQCATQILIWEIVMGLRRSTGNYALNDARLYWIYNGKPKYTTYGDNTAFQNAYGEIEARMQRHATYPSFAKETASSAPTYTMTYNSSKGLYEITLKDDKGVLSPDYNSFDAPTGVTVQKSGNSLTVTATAAAMQNGTVTVSMSGKKLQAGTQNIWVNSYNEQVLTSIDTASKTPAYFKLKATTVSIKKTANASASVKECIQDNPLYTLAGAVYEIHEGSATGKVVDTLTTDANGNATSTKQYEVGTVLYAVETKAPSGYLLNSEAVKLTVSAGNNVFEVQDTPTFDPAALDIKKTNTEGKVIPGTIFKASYYAQNWVTSTPQRVWYLKSDENGRIRFDDAHLITDDPKYPSDPLFKPNGPNNRPSFPLGCIEVKEVKAAPGFVLPKGTDGTAYIFIHQGGTDGPKAGVEALAYWGKANGKPISTTKPYGIYHLENDTLYGENDQKCYMYVNKVLTPGSTGSLEGYAYSLYCVQSTDGKSKTLRGRSGEDGRFYVTDANYEKIDDEDARVYRSKQIEPGRYTLREWCLSDRDNSVTSSIRFYITDSAGNITLDRTYSGDELVIDGEDRVIRDVEITAEMLSNGATMTIEIANMPNHGEPFEIKKIDPSKRPVEGAIFRVDFKSADNKQSRCWYFKTDMNGYFTLDMKHLITNHAVYQSDALYDPEKLPFGTMTVQEVEAPKNYRLNDFVGYWITRQSDSNGDHPYTVESFWATAANGTPTTNYGDSVYVLDEEPGVLYVENVPEVKLDVIKTSTNGSIKDIKFMIERQIGTDEWENIHRKGTYFKTDIEGHILLSDTDLLNCDLLSGMVLRITEIVPEGSICLSENPQVITLKPGTNTVNFENLDISLEIQKTATDGKIKDIQFEVMKLVDDQWTLLGTYKTDASGNIGIETKYLEVGAQFQIKEIVKAGYYCDGENPKTITLVEGKNTVSFQNIPLELEIVKTSSDGEIAGIKFEVSRLVSDQWVKLPGVDGYYITDNDGTVNVEQEYLLQGATYKIEEIVPENYICLTENPQVVTLEEPVTTVNFTNKPVVKLEIIKKCQGEGRVDNIQFDIRKRVGSGLNVRWEPLDPNQEFYLTDADGKILIDNENDLLAVDMTLLITEIVPDGYECISDNPITIKLQKGTNAVTFVNRPASKLELIKVSDDGKVEGITFVVDVKNNDDTYTKIGSYKTNSDGQIIVEGLVAGKNYRVTETIPEGYINDDPVREFIAQPGTNTVQFENRRIYGYLEITKVDESYPDHKLTGAEFTVTMTRAGSDETVSAIMPEVLDEEGKGTGVYRLEHLAYGTVCEIRETKAPAGYKLSDNAYHETITEEKTYVIADDGFDCISNRQAEGQIRVHKEDVEGNAMRDVQFLLEYSMDNGTTWAPIQARTAKDKVLPGYCTSEGLTDGILTTGADGNIVFTGLALSTEINSNVMYRLTEVKTHDGKTLLGVSVFNGPLTLDEPDLAYTVVNESVFQMPHTGSRGFTASGIGLGLCILAALFILFNLPKKKEENI